MTTDRNPVSRALWVLLGLLLLTLGGAALVFLRVLGVLDQDWVAVVGFAMVLGSWIATRRLRKSLASGRG